MTGDGLIAFNQVSGLAGTQPVPDLATSLPTPTDGGRTYTFLLRPGIRYSNGRPVQATDFRSTFERSLYALRSTVTDYDGIVGGAQCRKHPKRCDLSRGIVADDVAHTVTFHLVRPDPYFLYKLALPAVRAARQRRRGRRGTHPLPATGPYMIATYRRRRCSGSSAIRSSTSGRGPRSRTGTPTASTIRIAGTADEAIRDVVDGKADVGVGPAVTPPQLSRLELQRTEPAPLRPGRNFQALFLNTRVPPFNRLDARKAINFAVDRAAATNALGRAERRRADVPDPAAELPRLPPLLPVHGRLDEERHVDGTRPGEGEGARGTLGDARHEGHPLGVVGGKGLQPVAVKVLRSLGYRVAVKPVVGDRYWGDVGDSRNRAQIGFDGWGVGYPSPATFLVRVQLCSVPARRTRDNPEPRAVLRPGHRPPDAEGAGRAAERPDRVARTLATGRPRDHRRGTVGADGVTKDVNFLSKRVGNYQYSPGDRDRRCLDQLWVR